MAAKVVPLPVQATSDAWMEVKEDVRAGQDGLGSLVKVASKRSKRIDKVLHCCNGVGFAWADQQRVRLLSLNVILGLVCCGTAACGATGLWPGALHTLPWARYTDTPASMGILTWWNCGPAASSLNGTIDCFTDLVNVSNEPLWTGLAPWCGSSQSCASFLANATAAEADVVARVDWHLNQWGVCLFAHGNNTWFTAALRRGGNDGTMTLTREGGVCRSWGSLSGAWAGPELLQCKKPHVDGMGLLMGAFGGFMKIGEPISRMKRSTDRHQKTIVLLILTIGSIPPVVGLISFGTGCLSGLTTTLSDKFGSEAQLGLGCILFFISLLVLLPIGLVHLSIPAGATSARSD